MGKLLLFFVFFLSLNFYTTNSIKFKWLYIPGLSNRVDDSRKKPISIHKEREKSMENPLRRHFSLFVVNSFTSLFFSHFYFIAKCLQVHSILFSWHLFAIVSRTWNEHQQQLSYNNKRNCVSSRISFREASLWKIWRQLIF